jgi:hypothetical protein
MKKKEYKIQMTLSIESEDADYERVEQYAQELSESIMQDNTLVYDDIEIVETVVSDVQDLNDDEDINNSYKEDDEEEGY